MPPCESDDDDLARDWGAETSLAGERDHDAPAIASPVLVAREGGRTLVVDLVEGAAVLLGRAPECAIRIEDSKASRRHARVEQRAGHVVVEDLGSRNGTLVGERLLRATSLPAPSGTVIRIGGCEVFVAAHAGAPPRRASNAPASGLLEQGGLVVSDPAMHKLLETARRVAQSPATVLLLGETGVGKDVFAQRIHAWSKRASGPFVRVHCAAIPEQLLEGELFGHEKGAFTGADRRRVGYVESANGGTLFIDEIGELSAAAQVKLLGVLEQREVTRLGAATPVAVDVRLIAATNRDLPAEAAGGRFRPDLYYRLSSFVLRIPPLRERPAEVVVLADAFSRDLAAKAGEPPPSMTDAFASALRAYRWPGNVRELRNTIEHAMVLADGPLDLAHLPEAVAGSRVAAGARTGNAPGVRRELLEIERARIEEVLAAEGGNQTRAAAKLGMSRRTLVYKLARWRRE